MCGRKLLHMETDAKRRCNNNNNNNNKNHSDILLHCSFLGWRMFRPYLGAHETNMASAINSQLISYPWILYDLSPNSTNQPIKAYLASFKCNPKSFTNVQSKHRLNRWISSLSENITIFRSSRFLWSVTAQSSTAEGFCSTFCSCQNRGDLRGSVGS